jgi:hypothetical protein
LADVFCNNCGHRNAAGSNFCSSCGQPLDRASDEEPKTITFTLDQSPMVGDEVQVELHEVPVSGVLIATRGPNSGSEFALNTGLTTIGRHPDSDIFLDDVTVSRRHVEVEHGASGYRVRDVGSLNGTYLNQTLIEQERPLANGDELQVGRFKLVFVAGTDA